MQKPNNDVMSSQSFQIVSDHLSKHYPGGAPRFEIIADSPVSFGGTDPFDCVIVYLHEENGRDNIKKHWHYIGVGLCDFYTQPAVKHTKKVGIELTFRIKYYDEIVPPIWPVNILYSISKYMLESRNVIRIGDHIPWNKSINPNNDTDRNKIKNFLVNEDPQLTSIKMPSKVIHFRQLVGITNDELTAARNYKGKGVITLLAQDSSFGGAFLITDYRRSISIFEKNPKYLQVFESFISKEGSKFAHVSSNCRWLDTVGYKHLSSLTSETEDDDDEIPLASVKLQFDFSAAQILPAIATKGRLIFGKYLAFQSLEGQIIVFIPENLKSKSQASIVDKSKRLCVLGKTLQIFCDKFFIEQLTNKLQVLLNTQNADGLVFNFDNPKVTMEILSSDLFNKTHMDETTL